MIRKFFDTFIDKLTDFVYIYKKDFIIIFVLALFLNISVSLLLQINLYFNIQTRIKNALSYSEVLKKYSTEEELYEQLSNNPDNYFIMIKLANILASKGNYKKADDFYMQIFKLSNSSNFAKYNYALYCIKRKFYLKASSLAEELNIKNKKNIEYKVSIYEALGDSFSQDKQYEASQMAYQISNKYSKNISNKEIKKRVTYKYALSYVSKADIAINNGNKDEALSYLDTSLKIFKTPVALYKIGLIYINENKVKAQEYLSKAFELNQFIVNPYIYNKLLNDLIIEAKQENNYNLANFYNMKLNKFKNKLSKSYLYDGDITILNPRISTSKSLLSFFKEKEIISYYFTFDVVNNSKDTINKLYLKTEFLSDKESYETQVHEINYLERINSFQKYPIEPFLVPKEIVVKHKTTNNKIYAKIFAKKVKNAPYSLIKIESVNF